MIPISFKNWKRRLFPKRSSFCNHPGPHIQSHILQLPHTVLSCTRSSPLAGVVLPRRSSRTAAATRPSTLHCRQDEPKHKKKRAKQRGRKIDFCQTLMKFTSPLMVFATTTTTNTTHAAATTVQYREQLVDVVCKPRGSCFWNWWEMRGWVLHRSAKEVVLERFFSLAWAI